MPRKILIVDDERAIVDILNYNLQKNDFDTVCAYDGPEGLRLARQADPDLILLDVMLPGMDGFQVCRTLRDEGNNVPIIMITAREEETDKVFGLELGADDYAVKPFSTRELLARIKAVLRRSAPAQPQQNKLSAGSLSMDFSAYEAFAAGHRLALTPKEYELLKLFVTNPGRAFSRDELLEKVWGYEYYGDTRTVDVHIRHLRAKLTEADAALENAIGTVRGVGYRFEI